MIDPVLIISDTHYHKFSQYASVDGTGMNSRLADAMRATHQARKHLRASGGCTMFHAGDLFHVRGNIAPMVFNPVRDMYQEFSRHTNIHIINGNHDLETNDSVASASSAHAISGLDINVYSSPGLIHHGSSHTFAMLPWIADLTKLRSEIERLSALVKGKRSTLIIHAPMNGVLTNMPDHGLDPEEFREYNFQRVFSGHFHNHRDYDIGDGKFVTSVGALTHQNWGDVGSKAGYIIYQPDTNTIEHHETSAPKFIKVPLEELDTVDDSVFTDNYVKVIEGEFNDPTEVQAIRDELITRGAKAVVVDGLVKKPAATRAGASRTAPTIQTILGDYMDRQYPGDDYAKRRSLEILGEVS